eukprot:TRINITY_DN2325_c0_g1_i14.p2 TRINITY_DN2325_c0_g1~~TRINITY_DN2325_c0_g1_i14.p2  ORF type:complete len:209 (-),score=-11.45 TRINITY_DN2325_c0_g1_i14:518-1144(-)
MQLMIYLLQVMACITCTTSFVIEVNVLRIYIYFIHDLKTRGLVVMYKVVNFILTIFFQTKNYEMSILQKRLGQGKTWYNYVNAAQIQCKLRNISMQTLRLLLYIIYCNFQVLQLSQQCLLKCNQSKQAESGQFHFFKFLCISQKALFFYQYVKKKLAGLLMFWKYFNESFFLVMFPWNKNQGEKWQLRKDLKLVVNLLVLVQYMDALY